MGLLKFLIIAICVLWLLRMVARLVLPALFRKVVKKHNNGQMSINNNKEGRNQKAVSV